MALAPKKKLIHKTVAAAVAEQLRERILSGEFPGGFQLRQDALSEEFGVSRIPIREALLQLDAEGLVKIHPHRGAVVPTLSADEIKELFELRVTLEPMLLRASASQLTAANFDHLRQILADYSRSIEAQDVRLWGELNTEFHLAFYQYANRPKTLNMVALLLQECDRLTRMQLSVTGEVERAKAEHGQLIELCEAGKIDAACALLVTHIENVAQTLQHLTQASPAHVAN